MMATSVQRLLNKTYDVMAWCGNSPEMTFIVLLDLANRVDVA